MCLVSGFSTSATNANEVDSLKLLLGSETEPIKRADLMYDLGHAYFGYNKDSAIVYLEGAYQYYTLMNLRSKVSRTAAVLSMAYQNIDPAKSAQYVFEAVEIAEEINDPELSAYTYNIMGTHYRVNGEWDKAQEYFEQVIEIRFGLKDSMGVAVAYNNIGIVLMLKGEYDEGLDYWQKSLDMKLSVGEELSAAYSMANIAIYYKDIGRYLEAKEYTETALEIEKRLKDYEGCSHSLTVLGEMYILLNNYPKAISSFKESIAFSDSSKSTYDKMEPLLGLAEAYEKLGQYKNATESLKDYIEISEEQFNESKERIANEMRTKFESEKQEKENLELRSQNEINSAKLKEEAAKNELQAANNRYLVIGLGLILLILIAIVIFLNKVRSAKKEIELQKDIVEEKNREITDSISYAKRLQEAILPPDEAISEAFPQNFVVYQPKDIVAGDFYWMEQVEEKILIAAADCTGHGVPGAMVSVVCHNALNRATREFGLTDPGAILDKVTDLVIETFEKSQAEVKDGMDIALCTFDLRNKAMAYAGANNSVYIIRESALREYKATKQPIGKYADRRSFETHVIPIETGDQVYLFTDGFADQFGGDKGKKLKYKPFKELLLEASGEPMKDQKKNLVTKFDQWKGEYEQVDDVCVIGIRI